MTRYDDAVRQWQADLALLRAHRDLAASATTRPASGRPELKLRKGEEVFWESEGVTLVEVADTVNLFAPVHHVYSPLRRSGGYADLPAPPGSHRDTGHVVVTTERVFFDGLKANREWAFAQLTGVAHGTRFPLSLMRVGNRQRLSGLLFGGQTAAAFQFFLALAIAAHRGDRAGFVSHLAALEAHYAARPPAPTAAPRAPLTLRTFLFGRPDSSVIRKVGPSLATAVMLLCMVAVFTTPTARPLSSAGLEGTQTTTAPAPAPSKTTPAAQPSPTPSPSLLPTPAQAAVVVPVVPTTRAPSTTKAAPKPAPTTAGPEDTCGAPANPWGFDFCAGGSTISSPPSGFCSVFNCIDSFWENTNGYVMQCKDGMFSHSGGRSGSCSYHGGNSRALTT